MAEVKKTLGGGGSLFAGACGWMQYQMASMREQMDALGAVGGGGVCLGVVTGGLFRGVCKRDLRAGFLGGMRGTGAPVA